MDTLFERLLKEQLVLTRDMKVKYMTETRLDHEEYMHSLGYLEALKRVEDLISDIHAKED